jgi:hypothetical protein
MSARDADIRASRHARSGASHGRMAQHRLLSEPVRAARLRRQCRLDPDTGAAVPSP